MPTLDQRRAQLETLQSALARGVLVVRDGEQLIHYQTVADLIAAITFMEQLIASEGGATVVRSFRLTSSKDL